MKGAAQFIIGLMMIILVTMVSIADKNQTYLRHVDIATATAKIYEVENNAESVKRSLDSVVYFSGMLAAKETFEGAGAWAAAPSESDFKKIFEQKLTEKVLLFKPEKIGESDLEWIGFQPTTSFLDDITQISGARIFSIKNSGNPEISFSVAGSFNRNIPIRAKKVFSAGAELLGDSEWKIDKVVYDAEPEECKISTEGGDIATDVYTLKTKNLIATAIKCGYASDWGALSESTYSDAAVKQKISMALASLGNFMKLKTGLDYALTPEISASEERGKEIVSVNVLVSVSDKNSLVPSENSFVTLALKYSTAVQFEMPAAGSASQG